MTKELTVDYIIETYIKWLPIKPVVKRYGTTTRIFVPYGDKRRFELVVDHERHRVKFDRRMISRGKQVVEWFTVSLTDMIALVTTCRKLVGDRNCVL